MPDLTIEYIRACKQNTFFETQIPGSNGKVYTVTYCETPNGPYQYGWFCTCPHNTYRHQECKHIQQAKSLKCNWNVEAFMGNHADARPDGKCPECGGETVVIKVGV